MHHPIRREWNNIFFDEHFDAIRDRLKQAKRADAIWAEAVLHPPQDFSFKNGGDGEASSENRHQAGNGQRHRNQGRAKC